MHHTRPITARLLPALRAASLVVGVFAAAVLSTSPAHAATNPEASTRHSAVAVFPFKVLNPEKRFQHFGEGTSDAIITHIVREKALQIVEQSQLKKAVKTLARSQSTVFSTATALNMGEMLAARFIVIGSVDIVGEQLALNGRVLEVESGQLLVAERVHGPLTDTFVMYDALAKKLTRAMVKHLSSRLLSSSGDDANAADVADLLRRAKKLDPKFGGKDLNAAVELYKKAVVRDPQNPVTRFALGQALTQAQQWREARYNLDIALHLKPDYVPAMVALGYIEMKQGAKGKAESLFKKAVSLDDKYGPGHFLLGVHYMRSGNTGKARLHAIKAKKLGEKRAPKLLADIDARRGR